MASIQADAAVIGAGIAGLVAARELERAGLTVCILEARTRIGGRIDTRYDFASTPIEHGAEFVHGRHPDLLQLAGEAGLHLSRRGFDPLVLSDGDISPSQPWDMVFEALADPDAPDVPIAQRGRELVASGAWPGIAERALRRYVEGYMAADAERASARALSIEERAGDAIGSEFNGTIREGYAALTVHIAAGLDPARATILLDAAVRRVQWQRGSVRLDLADGRTVAARAAIVTVPLPILQRGGDEDGALAFEPALPAKTAAARSLAMGDVVKIFLRLRAPLSSIGGLDEPLAARLDAMTFLQTPAGPVPTWWKIGEDAMPILVGWVGGPAAARLAGKSEAEIVAAAIETLSRALAVAPDLIAACIDTTAVADWTRDPWSRGAYSWVPAGALAAPAELAAPVEGTLFFAGEATDTDGFRGTVHGAIQTALRAARQLLESAREETAQEDVAPR